MSAMKHVKVINPKAPTMPPAPRKGAMAHLPPPVKIPHVQFVVDMAVDDDGVEVSVVEYEPHEYMPDAVDVKALVDAFRDALKDKLAEQRKGRKP
jgi:hypothetical protein